MNHKNEAIRLNDIEVVQYCLKNGAKVTKSTLKHYILNNPDANESADYYIAPLFPILLDCVDHISYSKFVHKCVTHYNYYFTEAILKTNKIDCTKYRILLDAIAYGNHDIIKLLLAYGFSIQSVVMYYVKFFDAKKLDTIVDFNPNFHVYQQQIINVYSGLEYSQSCTRETARILLNHMEESDTLFQQYILITHTINLILSFDVADISQYVIYNYKLLIGEINNKCIDCLDKAGRYIITI